MSHNGRVPIQVLIGHTSQLLPEPNQHGHTHKWTVFVKCPEQDFTDNSFVEKVCFILHSDFPNPKRLVLSPPFEVSETGYAGFPIPIVLQFKDNKKHYKLTYDFNLTMEPMGYHQEIQQVNLKYTTPSLLAAAQKHRVLVDDRLLNRKDDALPHKENTQRESRKENPVHHVPQKEDAMTRKDSAVAWREHAIAHKEDRVPRKEDAVDSELTRIEDGDNRERDLCWLRERIECVSDPVLVYAVASILVQSDSSRISSSILFFDVSLLENNLVTALYNLLQ